MTVKRVDRWNLELDNGGRKLMIPVEASYDGGILSVFLDRVTNWSSDGQEPITQEQRGKLRQELERNYAGSGVTLEFDPAI